MQRATIIPYEKYLHLKELKETEKADDIAETSEQKTRPTWIFWKRDT
ncbi:hypothetical protein JXI42_03375 [bacterium]|nr:hypothetical protein [bacterium]